MILDYDPNPKTRTSWIYEGPFTIFFSKKFQEDSHFAKFLEGLKLDGFKVYPETAHSGIASCDSQVIEGIEQGIGSRHSNNITFQGHGIAMKKIETFLSYNYIEMVATASGRVLWKKGHQNSRWYHKFFRTLFPEFVAIPS
jgi:hypothetical protein